MALWTLDWPIWFSNSSNFFVFIHNISIIENIQPKIPYTLTRPTLPRYKHCQADSGVRTQAVKAGRRLESAISPRNARPRASPSQAIITTQNCSIRSHWIIFTGQSLRCQDLLPGYLQAVSRHKYWDQCQPLEIFRNKFVPSERRQRYFCFETRVSCSKSFVTRYDECGPGDLWLVSYEAFIRPHLIIHQS